MKMDNLETLAPQMAAGASPEVFHQLGLITRQLHDTLNQLGVMPKLQSAAEGLPDARSRLSYIARKTGDGTWEYGLWWKRIVDHDGDVLNLKVDLPAGWQWKGGAPPATVALERDLIDTWVIKS